PGRIGAAALLFNGDGAFDSTAAQSAVNVTGLQSLLGRTATLTAWVKTTQTGNDVHTRAPAITGVEQRGGNSDISWGWIDSTGHIGVTAGDGSGAQSAAPINDGTWHHVALTRDAASGIEQVY